MAKDVKVTGWVLYLFMFSRDMFFLGMAFQIGHVRPVPRSTTESSLLEGASQLYSKWVLS